ncbi:hypothetical protein DF186_20885, partial [Enterococcus hirae]
GGGVVEFLYSLNCHVLVWLLYEGDLCLLCDNLLLGLGEFCLMDVIVSIEVMVCGFDCLVMIGHLVGGFII